MSVAVYISKVAIKQRKRTPLAKVATWFVNRSAGTSLQPLFSFLFVKSVIARISTAIVLGLIIGASLDLSFQWMPTPYHSDMACALLGLAAGLLAQGRAGAFIGFFWGWLIGGIAD